MSYVTMYVLQPVSSNHYFQEYYLLLFVQNHLKEPDITPARIHNPHTDGSPTAYADDETPESLEQRIKCCSHSSSKRACLT